jgi:hypothetical protein
MTFTVEASSINNLTINDSVYHMKMVLRPKHVLAITTGEEKEDCSDDGIIVKLITWFCCCFAVQRVCDGIDMYLNELIYFYDRHISNCRQI